MSKHTSKTWVALSAMLSVAVVLGPVADAHAALNVAVTRPVTVEATVSTTNVLDIAVKNISDDQAATKMVFSSTTGVGTARQYIQVDFNSNAVGARVVLRTDNRNSAIPFTDAANGEGAGLVGNTDSKRTVPLLWAVFDDSAPAKAFVFTGDTDPGAGIGTVPGATARAAGEAEGLVVDKNNKSAPGTGAGETGGYEDVRVQGYATVVVPQGTSGTIGSFPVDVDGAGPSTGLRTATSPVFVAIGAAFSGVTAQTYSTTTLALDLITQ